MTQAVERLRKQISEIVDFAMANGVAIAPEEYALHSSLASDLLSATIPEEAGLGLRGRILLVDCDGEARELMARSLASAGHVVTPVADAISALSLLHAHETDMIITNLILPGMNGLEFLRSLSRDGRLRETPVIVISALSDIQSVLACMHAGARDFLPRPLDMFMLRMAVKRELMRMYREKRSREELSRVRVLTRVVQKSQAMVMVTDGKGKVVFVNRSFARTLGVQPEVCALGSCRALGFCVADKSGCPSCEKAWQEGEDWCGEMTAKTSEGQTVKVRCQITPVRDEGGHITHVVHEMHPLDAGTGDPLTGLPDRPAFLRELEARLRTAHRNRSDLAVVLLDVDRFRAVNATMGNVAGDQILREVAVRFASLEGDDRFVARWNGDCFAFLIAGPMGLSGVKSFADAVSYRMAEPFRVNGSELTLTMSLGASIFPRDADTGSTLIADAEEAVARASFLGGDRLVFYAPGSSPVAVK